MLTILMFRIVSHTCRSVKISENCHKYSGGESLGEDIHRREVYPRHSARGTQTVGKNAKGKVIGGREETPYFI